MVPFVPAPALLPLNVVEPFTPTAPLRRLALASADAEEPVEPKIEHWYEVDAPELMTTGGGTSAIPPPAADALPPSVPLSKMMAARVAVAAQKKKQNAHAAVRK